MKMQSGSSWILIAAWTTVEWNSSWWCHVMEWSVVGRVGMILLFLECFASFLLVDKVKNESW